MSRNTGERHHHSNLAFWMISIMHDNPLLWIFRNPYKLLKAAGLKPGHKVLEVGCGPGFFTIPAAEIVGEEGLIHTLDVHPLAVKKVQKKIEKAGVKNVRASLTNASETGLVDQSIDLAFFFGLPYVAGGLGNVISEMHRLLKPGGVLSFEKTRGSEEKLIQEVERRGFSYSGKEGRILRFSKRDEV